MADNDLQVPFIDGKNNQTKLYWYNKLVEAVPALKGTMGASYDPELVYYRLLNDGKIVDPTSPESLNGIIGDMAPTSRYAMPYYGSLAAAYLTGSTTQLKWLTWGDSMAQGIFESLYNPLRRKFGGNLAGVYLIGSSKSVTANITTGSVVESSTSYDAWPTGLVSTFNSGATRTYGVGGAGFVSNKIKIYYVKEAGAGTFKVQVDGIDVAGFESVSASGTLGELGVVALNPTLGNHTVKVVNLTGTIRVIGAGFENTTVSGIIPINVSKGGLELPDAMGAIAARTNFQAFLADVVPTVITHEMKENASWYEERLGQLLDVFLAGSPKSDVVLIATPEIGGTAHSGIAEQNASLRRLATKFGHSVFDADKAFGTYEHALSMDFYTAGDTVHYNAKGKEFLAWLFARDLNLFERFGYSKANSSEIIAEEILSIGNNPLQRTLQFLADIGSALDTKALVQRQLSFLSKTGIEDTNSWLIRPDNSNSQQIPDGVRVGSTGPFLRSLFAGERLSVMSARGGGTTKDFAARALIASGTGAYVGLPAVTTANRPTGVPAGATVLDMTLEKVITYQGQRWIDAMGTTV